MEENAKRREDGDAARRAVFERALHDRFLSTGGSEADWQREKAGIMAEARKQAAVAGEDVIRQANALRYR